MTAHAIGTWLGAALSLFLITFTAVSILINARAWVLRYVRGEPVDTGPVVYWVDRLIVVLILVTIYRYLPTA